MPHPGHIFHNVISTYIDENWSQPFVLHLARTLGSEAFEKTLARDNYLRPYMNPASEMKTASPIEERVRNEEQQQDLEEKIRVPREMTMITYKN